MTALALLLAATALAGLSGVPALLRRDGAARAATVGLGLAAAVGLAGVALVFGRGPVGTRLPALLPGTAPALACDSLSALFLLPILVVPALGSLYGERYWSQAEHPDTARRLRFFWGLTSAAMALVVLAADAITFLVGWEVMALSAFMLVTTEDRDREARRAGAIYLVASHAGALALFAAFALAGQARGGIAAGFGPLPAGFAATGAGTAFFLLALGGFGMKAGLMPLHVWLPGAHAAAPSHVSALLSGVLIKTGVYGLLRALSWCPEVPLWWAAALLLAGAASAVLGIAFALANRDLKRMLAYSSIENVGVVALAAGLAAAGRALGRPELAALGLAGALLHVLNHALFKSMLFFAAGAVVHATGTREIDRLGGLARTMPRTAAAFLLAAVAISALPPLNGFAGEWFVYAGLLKAVSAEAPWAWGAVGVAALSLVGALALACFARAFGAVFLGEGRTESAQGREPPRSMLAPMAVAGSLCLFIGLAPGALLPLLTRAAAAAAPELGGVSSAIPLDPLAISAVSLTLLAVAAAAGLALRRKVRGAARAPTWDCGYAAPSARMQYTASSFAAPIAAGFRFALRPREEMPVARGLFPAPQRYESHTPDTVLERAVGPTLRLLTRLSAALRPLQGGILQIYLVYVALTLLALLYWSIR